MSSPRQLMQKGHEQGARASSAKGDFIVRSEDRKVDGPADQTDGRGHAGQEEEHVEQE